MLQMLLNISIQILVLLQISVFFLLLMMILLSNVRKHKLDTLHPYATSSKLLYNVGWIKLLQSTHSLHFNDNNYYEGNISRMPDFGGFFHI